MDACERERKDAVRRKSCDDDDLSASKPLGERPPAIVMTSMLRLIDIFELSHTMLCRNIVTKLNVSNIQKKYCIIIGLDIKKFNINQGALENYHFCNVLII